jgi:GT2 family glycosyltransferase
MSSISVIIPQYGQQELTLSLVQALQQYEAADVELIVLDDESPTVDTSISKQIAGCVDQYHRLKHGGVTKAWNVGVKSARGEWLVFLNNDVEIKGPILQRLNAPLMTDSRCTQHPVLMTGVDFRQDRIVQQMNQSRPRSQLNSRFLNGWCFALPRYVLDDMRGFDERYQLYFSDTDFQQRLLQAYGGSCEVRRVVPQLPLKHMAHRSTCHLLERTAIWKRDRDLFMKRWATHHEADPGL